MRPDARTLDRFLHALADPARRAILRALKEKGCCSIGKPVGLCACDIEARVKRSQPTVSHHMAILTQAGWPLAVDLLGEAVMAIAFCGYMADGVRPNAYYRRRLPTA